MIHCPVLKKQIAVSVCEVNHEPAFGCPADCPHYIFGAARAKDLHDLRDGWIKKLVDLVFTPKGLRASMVEQMAMRKFTELIRSEGEFLIPVSDIINGWVVLNLLYDPSWGDTALKEQLLAQCSRDERLFTEMASNIRVGLFRVVGKSDALVEVVDVLSGEKLFLLNEELRTRADIGEGLLGIFCALPGFLVVLNRPMAVPPELIELTAMAFRHFCSSNGPEFYLRNFLPYALAVTGRIRGDALTMRGVHKCVANYTLHEDVAVIQERLRKSRSRFAASERGFDIMQEGMPKVPFSLALRNFKDGRYSLAEIILQNGMLVLISYSRVAYKTARRKLERALGDRISFLKDQVIDVEAQTAERMEKEDSRGLFIPSITIEVEDSPAMRKIISEAYVGLDNQPLPQMGGTLREVLLAQPEIAEKFLQGEATKIIRCFGRPFAESLLNPLLDRLKVPEAMRQRIWA